MRETILAIQIMNNETLISERVLHRKATFREISWVWAFQSLVLVFSLRNKILKSTSDHTGISSRDFLCWEICLSSQ